MAEDYLDERDIENFLQIPDDNISEFGDLWDPGDIDLNDDVELQAAFEEVGQTPSNMEPLVEGIAGLFGSIADNDLETDNNQEDDGEENGDNIEQNRSTSPIPGTSVQKTSTRPTRATRAEVQQKKNIGKKQNNNIGKKATKSNKKVKHIFTESDFVPQDTSWRGSIPQPPPNEMTPTEYFKCFFSEELFSLISEQSNLYAMQKDLFELASTPDEYEQLIGMFLLMGIVHMPSIRMYWARETRYPPIADTMSRNRFILLTKYFHVNDNSKAMPPNDPGYDKLHKISPLLNSIKSNMQSIPPEEYHAVDEQMIPYKGRHTLKQYIRNKPHKWGFKCFTRSGATGMMYDFEIYVGKNTCEDYGLGFSANIVLALTEILPENQNFKVAFDNWFASIDLASELKKKGILCVGSVRSDRMGNPPLASQDDLKHVGRGSYDFTVEKTNNICLVRWFDSKAINLLPNYAGVEPVDTCKRWSKSENSSVEITRPHIVQEYNLYMGGVDLTDMLTELYRINIRSTKWYMQIIFWCIGICTTNAWTLYRRHCMQLDQQCKFSLLQFQACIGATLITAGKELRQKKRGRPSLDSLDSTPKAKRTVPINVPYSDTRYDGVGHWPTYVEKQSRCRLCTGGFTQLQCQKCKINLCLTKKKNCFYQFHVK